MPLIHRDELDGPTIRGEDHGASISLIIDESEPGGSRSWINFEAQGCRRRLFNPPLEDEREWVRSVDGCLARFEQQACSPWMHGVKWLLVGIEYKNLGHLFCPFGPPLVRVMGAPTSLVSGLAVQALS